MELTLLTAGGDFVTKIIPSLLLKTYPEVIVWGERVFIHQEEPDLYREAFVWIVHDWEVQKTSENQQPLTTMNHDETEQSVSRELESQYQDNPELLQALNKLSRAGVEMARFVESIDRHLTETQAANVAAAFIESFPHLIEANPQLTDALREAIETARKHGTVTPAYYAPPLRIPLYWKNETSGQLPLAIKTYVFYAANPKKNPPPTPEQIRLIAEYFRYFIYAPCWVTEGCEEQIANLRRDTLRISSISDISTWINACLELGIDPL